MRISMKSDYALRAMLELAAAHGGRPLQSSEIAARRGIPESYLEQLLTVLRKAGFINSIRGPQGGHQLAMHPSRVTVGDIVRALEGPVVAVDCLDGSASCQLSPNCALQEMWAEVRAAAEAALDGVTLEDLASREDARAGRVMYHI